MPSNFANTPVKLDSNGYLCVTTSGAATGFGNGSAAAPSIFFTSQTGLGFYRSSANHITIANDGATGTKPFDFGQSLTINSSGLLIWASTTDATGASDSGISRLGAASFAFGAAAANSTTGTLSFTTLSLAGKTSTYNGVATTGQGIPSIYGAQRVVQTTAATAFVAYTSGAADETLEISANVLVTTHGSEAITVACSYTDESGTARVATLAFASLAGAVAPTVGAAGPFFGQGIHIRARQTTAVSVATTGTFTGATYNADGIIRKLA